MIPGNAFMAIADPDRRHLLEKLRCGPRTVGQLASGLPVHPKVLLDAGLVSARPDSLPRTRRQRTRVLELNIWLD
jgi:hypothetical protein